MTCVCDVTIGILNDCETTVFGSALSDTHSIVSRIWMKLSTVGGEKQC